MKLIGEKRKSNLPFKITSQRREESGVRFYSRKTNFYTHSYVQNAKTRIPFRIMVASNNQAKSKSFIREVRKNPGILCLLSKVFIMFHIKSLGLDVLSGISCAKLPIFSVPVLL